MEGRKIQEGVHLFYKDRAKPGQGGREPKSGIREGERKKPEICREGTFLFP